ncbi:hypothetical protein KTT_41990 [Tengunoibacter tsumagoiensis]|uniref:BACON domain-containing protein n=2 Tax=Tengunoibacter tsumagoiensis TaxID=2014871 RepID=A0A402A5G3_9CHLR|nr:hypothetical protein KTT_41990 [Tengunoibacter tsumagoiensis]
MEQASVSTENGQEDGSREKGIWTHSTEQTVLRLNNAARRISEEEPKLTPSLRASRLSRLLDISAEIQRDSTPLPPGVYVPEPERAPSFDSKVRELWPWLQEPEIEEGDDWDEQNDPLQARMFPSNPEFKQIDTDMRRVAEATTLYTRSAGYRYSRLRKIFIGLAVLALVALLIDTLLLSVAFTQKHGQTTRTSFSPSLNLSQSSAKFGSLVTVHLRNFSSSTQVFLTRDIEEQIAAKPGNPIQVNADGSADANLVIDGSWDPGSHTLQAEDIRSRYTANATLRVDSGPTRPAHFDLDTTSLDFGTDTQDANTTKYLNLKNDGEGSITWSASCDQPWLQLTPSQGKFSSTQKITVAAQRSNLSPADYTGTITITTNVGMIQHIPVKMTVAPLPTDAGPVLAITPAVLTFTAVDGYTDPDDQFVQISNPGSQPLYWTIGGTVATSSGNGGFVATPDPDKNWLSAQQTSGIITPSSTSIVRIKAHSQHLLPGTYLSNLIFSTSEGHSALNSPQIVSVSLTVQRLCGLSLNTGSLTFNAVSGLQNPVGQSLTFTANSSCLNYPTISWSATSSSSWLSLTAKSGQLRGVTSAVTTVNVNQAGLAPGTYTANIVIALPQSTQSVTVTLTVQAPPPPSAPILGASPLSLNFSATPAQPTPPGQTVIITNPGNSQLLWSVSIPASMSSWLSATPASGSLAPAQTGQVTITVSASALTTGTYAGQVQLIGVDKNGVAASGSPQTVGVNFSVQPPCTLSPPPSSSVIFTATQGMADPSPQTQVITASGSCNWPVGLNVSITPAASWLKTSAPALTLGSSIQTVSLTVTPSIAGLVPGIYTAQIALTATDSASLALQGSPQSFQVTLNVQQPCTLQALPSSLAFTALAGQSASAQTINLNEVGNCSRPVSWSVAGDAGSSKWLNLSPLTGTDAGTGGTVSVSANASQLTPGSYTGTLTVMLAGSGGASVVGSPTTITVTFTVTGTLVSGTVLACPVSVCDTRTLAGAKVTLLDTLGNTVASATTDASGKFSLPIYLPSVTGYTLKATGTDSNNVTYSGSVLVTTDGKTPLSLTVNASS